MERLLLDFEDMPTLKEICDSGGYAENEADAYQAGYLVGTRTQAKVILDHIGKMHTDTDGWVRIPYLNWREIRRKCKPRI